MPLFGWDASDFDWQRGPVDVAAAVRDGITWFTHKATEGTKLRHVHYGDALTRAKAAGVPFMGAYMVVRTPGNNGEGTVPEQVAYFLAYLDEATPWWRSEPRFFLQVDTEHWGYDQVDPATGAAACTLLRAETGKWVVQYAPRWAYGDSIPGSDPLWASAYGSNPTGHYREAYPGDDAAGWTAYSGRTPTFLQYGSKLTIGTQPQCDASAYRGTLDQLRTIITGGTMTSPLTADQDEKLTELHAIARMLHWAWSPDATAYQAAGGDPKVYASIGGGALVPKVNQIIEAVSKLGTNAITQDMLTAAVKAALVDLLPVALKDPEVAQAVASALAGHVHVS